MYIVTFYSFKGGVGRTMALANVAVELAQGGKKVLVVDFDLEAPGVESYGLTCTDNSVPGVVDYVHQYMESGQAPDVRDFVFETELDDLPPIHVMRCGKPGPDYALRLQEIDWQKLYREEDGFLLFEDLKAQWNEFFRPDYVLIDSRTGHTDVAGICTRQLPDAVVLLFIPNSQNLAGLQHVVADIRGESTSQANRKTRLLFVPSNIPRIDDEDQILKSRLENFQNILKYKEESARIHNYSSMDLLDQKIFAIHRPRTSLAGEYRNLEKAITIENPQDREGSLRFLRRLHHQWIRRDFEPVFGTTGLNQMQLIQEEHPSDGEVLFQLGRAYKEIGNFEDADGLFSTAFDQGYDNPALTIERARLREDSGDKAASAKLLRTLFDRSDVSPGMLSFIVRRLRTLSLDYLDSLPKSAALESLNPADQLRIASDLCISRKGLELSEIIVRGVLEEEDLDAVDRNSAVRQYSLCLVGMRRFQDAMDRISSMDPDFLGWNIGEVFNYGMAAWAEKREIPSRFFERVIELDIEDEASPPSANYEQCLAIASWGTGEKIEAKRRLETARRIKRARTGFEFSCWRYLEVRSEEFNSDLGEIERLIEGAEVTPYFFNDRSSAH